MIGLKQLQLLWVYQSKLLPDTGIKKHSHEYFQIICIQQGSFAFVLDDIEFRLKQGETVIIPKGCWHSFQNDSDEATLYYEIKFTILDRLLYKAVSSCDSFVRKDSFSYQLITHIADEYLYNRAQSENSAIAALSTLLYHCTSEQRAEHDGETPVIDTTNFNALSKKVVDYISEHYSEDLTLDDIAAGVGMSKNYLCNAFKRDTGITILHCLNMIRIRKAAELIVYSDLPLPQVASMSGFVSASHFNRVFSNYTGIPPGQCRRAYSLDIFPKEENAIRRPGAFIYSVLAGKSISPQVINESWKKDLTEQ